jgi:hypothetical protein
MEVSAKDGTNVEESVQALFKRAVVFADGNASSSA